MTVETRFYSWDDLHALCDALARDIVASGRRVDTIVAIARGGLLPALILSFALKVRDVQSISITTTIDDAPGAPRVLPIVRSALRVEEIRGRHCLLVDDVVDTGATMHAARRALEELGAAEVIGAAMIWSKLLWLERGGTERCAADFWADELDIWASVPWEPAD